MLTGTSSDGSLTCVGMCYSVYSQYQSFLIFHSQDINECTMNPTICGFGTCSVTSDGLYQCSCQDGAMITGSNTDGSLTCIGNVIDALLPPKKLLKSSIHMLHYQHLCYFSVIVIILLRHNV